MRQLLHVAITLLAAPLYGGSTVELQPGTLLDLATAEEAAPLMIVEDEYFARMSPFDREVRMRVAEPPSREAFAANVAANVRTWSEKETALMQAAVARLRPQLESLHLALPAKITVVKTTGREDVGFPYCRGPLIVFPLGTLRAEKSIAGVLAHELFHVFSTHHPELRPRLYGLLGFTFCGDFLLPAETDRRRLTNPDAPRYDYTMRVLVDGREAQVVPVLLGKTEHFDPTARGSFLEQVEFRLIEIELTDGRPRPVLETDGTLRTHLADAVPEYRKRMAQNTGYIWHPEEVLADNFMHLLLPPPTPLAHPELPARLRELIAK